MTSNWFCLACYLGFCFQTTLVQKLTSRVFSPSILWNYCVGEKLFWPQSIESRWPLWIAWNCKMLPFFMIKLSSFLKLTIVTLSLEFESCNLKRSWSVNQAIIFHAGLFIILCFQKVALDHLIAFLFAANADRTFQTSASESSHHAVKSEEYIFE